MRHRYTLLLTVLLVPIVLVMLVLGVTAASPAPAPAFPDPGAFFGYIPLHSLTLNPDSRALSYLLRSPAADRLYLIADGGVTLVDAETSEIIAQASSPEWTALRLALDPDGARLLVYPEDENTMPLVVLDAETLQPLHQYSMPELYDSDVVIGKEHFYLAPIAAYAEGPPPYPAVYVHDIASGTVITTVEIDVWAERYHLALHDELLYLGVGGHHGNVSHVSQFSLSTGVPVLSDTMPSGFVEGMALSPDGSQLAVLSDRLQLFSTHPLVEVDSRPYHVDEEYTDFVLPYTSLSFSPDGAYLYASYVAESGANFHLVDVLDVATLEAVLTFSITGHFLCAPQISVLANGDLAATYNDFEAREVASLDFYTPATAQVMLPMVSRDYCGGPLQDNFEVDNGRWPVADHGNIAYRYDGGEYVIEHRSDQWAAASAGDVWQDGKELQVTARAGRGDAIYGLVFSINQDWSDFYSFEIVPSLQAWFLLHFTDGPNGVGWYRIAYGQNAAIHPTGPNRLRLSKTDGEWGTMIVNDVVVSGSLVEMPDGRVGLSAGSLTNSGAEIRFDDYLLVGAHCPLPGNNQSLSPTFTTQESVHRDFWQDSSDRPDWIWR